MHNPTSVLEIGIHKLLWDFDIQTEHDQTLYQQKKKE